MADTNAPNATPVQMVAVVDGDTGVLGALEGILDAGRYDVVFVKSSDRAYSHIRTARPDFVIVCTRIDQLESFQLLSMLQLDPGTRDIPVLTCTIEPEGQDLDAAVTRMAEEEEAQLLPRRQTPARRMN
ncbi:MAG: hypothetical protein HY824_01290 [Acidobacteria bacterium]|nr:hypothetical protein [Acidobacteriota bacterium]